MLDDAAEIMLFNFFVRGKGMLLDDDDSVSNISYSYFRITLETLPSMYIPLSIIHTKYIAHLPSYHTLDSIMQWISNNIKDFRSWCWIIKSESSQWTKNAEVLIV
jgi:hypothetical protein